MDLSLLIKSLTWEFIAITLFCAGTGLAIIYGFILKNKIQQISLVLFLSGAFLWFATILVQSVFLAIIEIKKIGWLHFLISIFGFFFALYAAWVWIKKNKKTAIIGILFGIFIMVFFATEKVVVI